MKLNRTSFRTVEILKFISASYSPVTLEMICSHFNMPKTSAYDILSTLVATSMISQKQGGRNTYSIGLSAYQIGMAYKNNLNFATAFGDILQELAIKLKKTMFFAVRSDNRIVYVLKYEPHKPIITTGKIGGSNPMYCTSLGKAIMANLPLEEAEKIIDDSDLVKLTPYTITDKEKLLAELVKIKEQGYAIDHREIEEHGVCVGAPVFDSDGKLLGAISASDLFYPNEDYNALGRKLNQVANGLSKIMGR